MGKVRLTIGIILVVLLFVFAFVNTDQCNVRFFLKAWSVPGVPLWGLIYISLIVGLAVGYLFRGGHRKKKKGTDDAS